jgi:hypothetical protein
VAGAKALVIGCGALARELLAVAALVPGLEVACLAPDLHNRPGGIPAAVRERIRRARRDGYEQIFIAYADCGTGGLLEPVLAAEGVERLPGAHCYEVFAGSTAFAAMADEEPGTFWLTDFLARNFERLVIRGLGIDRHPELQQVYFANYRRVVYLAQTDDPNLLVLARRAADRLGLAFEHRRTGVVGLERPLIAFAARAGAEAPTPAPGAGVRPANTSDASDTPPPRNMPSTTTNPAESVDPARRTNRFADSVAHRVASARGVQDGAASTVANGAS